MPRQTPGTLAEIAQQLNPLLRGWIAYYCRYSRSALSTLADYVNRKRRRGSCVSSSAFSLIRRVPASS
ncbi:group II intron maturase-specific domain-containing protein [Mesorhizobium abyssinicae]|uniref:group II intron maturase-specific domain-containing protein n=1 Tax=Mesorhizobium abyssinicae TaxID=1209958 RepID=UPI002A246E4D|nr:group II intron maturase-specific domain-containing protein [Mesorhizobium abyssinicae]MDX8437285.1 group II intron maturase-specific domain-containing protein [Mesorhizobium abyssinicae]